MKILKPGKNEKINWWYGLILTCPNCEQQIQLEKHDNLSANWVCRGPGHISILCSGCSTLIDARESTLVVEKVV